jgi:membrane-bound lytic murein transglycosylase MltF
MKESRPFPSLLVAALVLGGSLAPACAAPTGGERTAAADAGAEDGQSSATRQESPAIATAAGGGAQLARSTTQEELPEELAPLSEPWFGDFEAMAERRIIRFLLTFNVPEYFIDGVDQRGITFEAAKLLEQQVNEDLDTGYLKVHVVIIPVSRARLLPALVEGFGDIAAGNLTITPERQAIVDFTDPVYEGVDEILVSGPNSPPVSGLDELAGKEVHVRASSSYYESLLRLNASFRDAGKPEVRVVAADEILSDEDLVQMVSAGLIPLMVMDSHKAEFWAQIFEDITLHPDIAVRTGGEIAWAFRKDSPQLEAVLNELVEENRKGTLMGNILFNRYLRDTTYVNNSLAEEDLARFRETVGFFREYAGRYDLDWLLVAAQGYQESRLDQSARSSAGAIGVMQLLRSTAADPNVGIPDIEILENNIHAGVKYLRFILDRYFADAEMDRLNKGLFAFAAYNAGPARVAGLRRQAAELGLDPNVWFNNVEVVAAREIGRETVQYVSNIYKYYVAYTLIIDELGLEGPGD